MQLVKKKLLYNFFLIQLCINILFTSSLYAQNLEKIEINGNIRISNETIQTF